MKQLLKRVKQISILILAISLIGCQNDETTYPKVLAGFTYILNADTGTVTFINTSENGNTYNWNFGDENTSTEINPVKTYSNGTYTVTLKAKNSSGTSDTFSDDITILIPETATLPISFDGANTKYEPTVFGGASFAIVNNPAPGGSNTSTSKVGAITNIGAAYEGIYFDLGSPIDLTTNKSISMNFWSDTPVNVLIKLEEGTGTAIEATAIHGGTGWETIIFNFTSSNSYSRLTLFVDGPGTTAGTFYLDDITQIASVETIDQGEISDPCAGSLLEDFETSDNSIFGNFGGGTAVIIDNPNTTVNTSAKVGQMQKFADQLYGGTTMTLSAPVDFTNGEVFTMDVFSQRSSALTFKLEGLGIEEVISTAGTGWETMTFDFTGRTTGAAVPAITLIFDNGTNGDAAGDPDAWTFLFDNLRLCDSGTSSDQGEISDPCAGSLLQDYETADNSIFGNFGGGIAVIIDNPNTTVNTSAKVGQMEKFADQLYGGTTMTLSAPVDFTNGEVFTMDVFSKRASALTFKLEGLGIEEVISTAGTGWETMTFDFTGRTTGAAVPAITLIFDNGTNGDAAGNPDAWTFLFDNLRLCDNTGGGGSCPAPPAGEFITDGDFEANAGCWELIDNGGIVTISTTISNGGSNSGQIKTAPLKNPALKQTRFGVGSILPNTTYVVKFDIKASSPLVDGAVFQAFTFSEPADGSGLPASQHILVAGDPNVTAAWVTRNYEFTTAANVDGGLSLLFELVCGGAGTCDGTVNIDNVSLKLK